MTRSYRLRKRKKTQNKKKIAGVIALAVAFGLLAILIIVYGTGRIWLKDLPDISNPEAFKVAETTKIYSANNVLLADLFLENRESIPLAEMSPHLLHAAVAVEDERFYEHQGVDFVGLARAVLTNLSTEKQEGASTLTQQYIRNTVLTNERYEMTIKRKFREAWLAIELESRYSKDEILDMYLNTVYFGEGAYGVEAAAKTYFNKHAGELTIAEAALLAGLPQSPNTLSPYVNPTGAIERRNWVLTKMYEQEYITADEYATAEYETPVFEKAAPEYEPGVHSSPYFVSYVKKLLQDQYGTALVFQGGLTVYTSLDTTMQAQAEESIKGILNREGDPEASLVALDPKTGYIKAMVGGQNWETEKFNLATQISRQCGSAFKAFTLIAAIEEGMPPAKRKVDGNSPATIETGGEPWVVNNCEGTADQGYITIEQATINSINAAYARLISEIGAEKVANIAHKMGIQSELSPYLSLTLGTSGVNPLEMASAFGTLATNGKHFPTAAITKVVDSNDQVIFEANPVGEQVLGPDVAYATTEILQKVVSQGTATNARIGRPQAGKTGTTQDYRDAWFVGYTPDIVAAVWMGYSSEKPMTNVHGRVQFGGTFPAMIWHDFMIEALKDVPETPFKKVKAPWYTWLEAWDLPEIPNVIGLPLDEAITILQEEGYENIKIEEEYSDTVPVGYVFEQDPSGEITKDPEDIKIKLTVSMGPFPFIPPPFGEDTTITIPPGKRH